MRTQTKAELCKYNKPKQNKKKLLQQLFKNDRHYLQDLKFKM